MGAIICELFENSCGGIFVRDLSLDAVHLVVSVWVFAFGNVRLTIVAWRRSRRFRLGTVALELQPYLDKGSFWICCSGPLTWVSSFQSFRLEIVLFYISFEHVRVDLSAWKMSLMETIFADFDWVLAACSSILISFVWNIWEW